MRQARFNRNLIAMAHDAVMAGLSFFISLWLRLGPDQMGLASDYLKPGIFLFMLTCIAVFSSMRLYRGLWRYASMRDLVTITKAVTLAILVFAILMFSINRLQNVPRSVFFINWMLLLFMLAGPRFIYRALKDRTLMWQMTLDEKAKLPVLLIGAHDNAERFIRDMARDPAALYEAVGIADDDPERRGRSIHDVSIYGDTNMLHSIVELLAKKGKRPAKMILTDDKASGAEVRRLLDASDGLGIPLARLPKASEVKTGISERPDIQPIAVEDLLKRPQNVLDRASMQRLIAGKKVLVSGAGGTIGSELVRQIAAHGPESLILLEMSEFNLYQIERELRALAPALPLKAILADVRDARHMDRVFAEHKPSIVFHAAAIKHVPLAEKNLEEAVLTNVFGTHNVAEACLHHQAEIMVMISTDKAVNPSNIMGATKRLAENICQALGKVHHGATRTRFVTVRFGNVLGSTGSVVPLFTQQLAEGGPLTITHPEMTRYFMTTREAVELVLQAAALGVTLDRQECIFVLDMGQPIRILDLALQMIKLAGLKPQVDIKITYSGIRPGEKLHEELFHFSENAVKTPYESILLSQPRPTDMAPLRKGLDQLLAACRERNHEQAYKLLSQLVPEFQPVVKL